jgi:PAS domain S-box-containing protein
MASDVSEKQQWRDADPALLASIVDSSDDAIISETLDNEATTKVTGVTLEGLIGTDFSDYFTEPEKAREGYQRVFAEGAVTDYPLTIRDRDGGLTDVLYNASVYRDATGSVLGVFAAARDVTKRKQAEQELALRAELLNLAHDAVIVREPTESRVTFWNNEAQAIYGYSRPEAVGQVTHELLVTVFPESRQAVDDALERDGGWVGELRHTCKDGGVIVVSSRQALQHGADGRPIAIIELNSDVTECRS